MFLALTKLAGQNVFSSWSLGTQNTSSHVVIIKSTRNRGRPESRVPSREEKSLLFREL